MREFFAYVKTGCVMVLGIVLGYALSVREWWQKRNRIG